jgi:phage I-like protein
MPDEMNPDNGTEANEQDGGRDAQQPDLSALPEWAREKITGLESRLSEVNQESAGRRHQINELTERLQRLEQARQAGLSAEERAKELEAQTNSLRQFEDKAKQLEALIRESNARRIEQLPEDRRGLIPADELAPDALAAYLDRNWQTLTKPTAPNLDGGKGGGGSSRPPVLTDDEKAMAARFGMSAEEWVKYKERSRK